MNPSEPVTAIVVMVLVVPFANWSQWLIDADTTGGATTSREIRVTAVATNAAAHSATSPVRELGARVSPTHNDTPTAIPPIQQRVTRSRRESDTSVRSM